MDTGIFFVSSRITHVIGCGSSEANIAEKEENKKFSPVGLGVDAYNRQTGSHRPASLLASPVTRHRADLGLCSYYCTIINRK